MTIAQETQRQAFKTVHVSSNLIRHHMEQKDFIVNNTSWKGNEVAVAVGPPMKKNCAGFTSVSITFLRLTRERKEMSKDDFAKKCWRARLG